MQKAFLSFLFAHFVFLTQQAKAKQPEICDTQLAPSQISEIDQEQAYRFFESLQTNFHPGEINSIILKFIRNQKDSLSFAVVYRALQSLRPTPQVPTNLGQFFPFVRKEQATQLIIEIAIATLEMKLGDNNTIAMLEFIKDDSVRRQILSGL